MAEIANPLASSGAGAWHRTPRAAPWLTGALARAATPAGCLVLAILSVWLQGFQLGVDNNVFHLPIVLRWYDLPQFAGDPFIQSLRLYATPVFRALAWISDAHDVATVFLAAHLVTRSLTFFALAEIGRAAGVRGARLAAVVGVLAFSSAVYGNSGIGRDELLVDVFTHTALAQAVALLSVAWLVRGRILWACLAAGLALDLNVMVGVWQTAPIVSVAAIDLLQRRATPARVLTGAAVFGLAAAPVAAWILLTQDFGRTSFDYRAFLIDYYPFHFFIGWAPWPQRVALAFQALAGLAAARFLPRGRVAAAAVLLGFCAVFLGGAVVDQVTHSRLVLNLHLLRVDAMIAWMAALLTAIAAVTALSSALVFAPGAVVVVGGLAIARWDMVAAGMVLLLLGERLRRPAGHSQRREPSKLPMAAPLLTAAALIVAAVVGGHYCAIPSAPVAGAPPTDAQLAGARPASPEWLEVGEWARTKTSPSAMFLAPWKLDFTVTAQRRSWVGWKEGAVAMWAPETYSVWRSRGAEVRTLRDVRSQLAYACLRHIDYVIVDHRPSRAAPDAATAGPAVFANRWFSVVRPTGCAAR